MTFSELITLARLYTPGAKKNQVSDDDLKVVINAGAVDVASMTKCLEAEVDFQIEAGVREYKLNSVAPNFLSIKKEGVWIWNGSEFKKIYPKTRKWLDNEYVNWRGQGQALPIYYYIESNIVGFYKTPATTYASGAKIYYYRKPQTMVNDNDIPFHVYGDNQTEISSLSILNDSILDYCKWKLSDPLSKPTGEIISRRNDYYRVLQDKMKRIERREDINTDTDTKRRQRPKWGLRGSY